MHRCLPNCAHASQQGKAALVVVNLLVLMLILAVGFGYYFLQMRPSQAAQEYARGLELQKKGHLTGAELAYREAIRLDPKTAEYHRSLASVHRSLEGIEEPEAIMPEPGEPSDAASAALWPEEARDSGSAPSPSPSPATATAATDDGGAGPVVNTKPRGRSGSADAPPVQKNVAIKVLAPRASEYQLLASNVPVFIPGEVLQPWISTDKSFQGQLPVGKYEIVVRAPEADPEVEAFAVSEKDGALRSVAVEFGLLKIDSEPTEADVLDGVTGEKIGVTPLVQLRKPGLVSCRVVSSGHEDSEVEGEVYPHGVIHFNHRLAKIAPVEKMKPAVAAKENGNVPATSEPGDKPKASGKPKPEKPTTTIARVNAPEAVAEKAKPEPLREPVLGEGFVSRDGLEYFFGEKSNRGDPFWMTKTKPLKGFSNEAAQRHCRQLTDRERAAGRVPSGYGYFPSLAGDGRIALCRAYVEGKPSELATAAPVARPVSRVGEEAVQPARPVVRATVVENTGAPAARPYYGKPFINGHGVRMDYRSKDYRGNPFWISASPVVGGKSLKEALRYCELLTSKERGAGRLPSGYTYAVSADRDGRIVLARRSPANASR